jgi:hypothetical protein
MATTTKTGALMALAVSGLLGLGAGVSTCGGVTDARTAARDKATTATCNRFSACNLIGADAGESYFSYDSCTTIWRGKWEEMWPPSLCAEIDQEKLNVCLSAIGGTDCTSVLDFLTTLGKCQAVDICVAAAADAASQ